MRARRVSEFGKFQQSFACLPLTATGGVAVPSLKVNAPVFVGLQGPLEILPMTDGRRLLEIKGQIVNLSGRPMKLQGVFLRLVTPADATAYHTVLPLDFMVDYEANRNGLDPPIT